MALQHACRQDRGGGAAAQASPGLVHQEDAIGVAVEGQAHVGAGGQHPGLQAREHRRDHEPTHPVGGVGHDAQRVQLGHVDEGHHVLGEGVEEVDGGDHTPGRHRGRRVSQLLLGPGLDVGQAALLADRAGPAEAHLQPVVLGRVVRGREHRARSLQAARGEVQHVGRGQADVDDVDASAGDTFGERRPQLHTGRAHVPTEHHLGSSDVLGKRHTEGSTDGRVELLGHRAPDVVGLDDLIEGGHSEATLPAGVPGGAPPGQLGGGADHSKVSSHSTRRSGAAAGWGTGGAPAATGPRPTGS